MYEIDITFLPTCNSFLFKIYCKIFTDVTLPIEMCERNDFKKKKKMCEGNHLYLVMYVFAICFKM